MSTNQTTNYGLHSWEPEDDFLRAEINENFTAIDAALDTLDATVDAKTQVVCGSYTGNGASTRDISLGFRPRAILVVNKRGDWSNRDSFQYGGMIVDGAAHSNIAIAITATGFQAKYGSYSQGNTSGDLYMYFAFR